MRSIKVDIEAPLKNMTDEHRQWWNNWVKKAEKATDKALKHWETEKTNPPLNSAIWKELKEWLTNNVFFGKCAYCEGKITDVSYGDAEHYRPKGKITVKTDGDEEPIKTDNDKNHPGYFWLAYNWRNLLPACQLCNTSGKGTLFPVKQKHLLDPSLDPDQLDKREGPLLLHPYEHNTEKHLEFTENGIVKPRNQSEEGRESIETYKLDRKNLEKARKERQQDSFHAYLDALNEFAKRGVPFSESLGRWTGREATYSAAVKAFIEKHLEKLSEARLSP